MIKLITIILFFIFILPAKAFAIDSFVSIVNPIRGADFWDQKNQEPITAVKNESEIIRKYNLPVTWLIRFDALLDQKIISSLDSKDEKGIFLEITPSLTKEAGVAYHEKGNWHDSESAFLSGYERSEREKLIDKSFEKFKEVFGFFPKSVGAWWIDAYSLGYMQKKYGISGALIVADQYTTDNYQIWGQYFGTPYYPSKTNVLHPAQSEENKLPVVITQWATRDPVNGYGNGVEESTFSLQANDYLDYHNLNSSYFSKLIDVYTKQPLNSFSQLVVGLENSYSWKKYGKEYENQIKVLSDKKNSGQLSVINLENFAKWYQSNFPNLSPEQVIIADDPLGSQKKSVWFMNPYYRAAWFFNAEGSVFRDIRQYIDGQEELCFEKRCSNINFATSATRVLDDVSFGQRWIIDQGKIRDFNITKDGEKYVINYTNEAGNKRLISFFPRDIGVDGVIKSIDGAILEVINQHTPQKLNGEFKQEPFQWSLQSVFVKTLKFFLFLIFVCLIPGQVLVSKLFGKNPHLKQFFLSLIVGWVSLVLIFYIVELLRLRWLIFIYLILSLIFFIKTRLYRITLTFSWSRNNLLAGFIILLGSIFQVIPTFRSSLTFPYGLGFWGPNTHDGIWHLSLINQLLKTVPPQNPIFAGETLKNYHFFFDLLVAASSFLSTVAPVDLLFKFYPIIFSLLLGIGSYYLSLVIFKNKLAAIFGLYFVYFAGSFGWIASYLRDKTLAGESAFWANQSISFNLNPPFAISLLIIIAFLILFLENTGKKNNILLILLAGSLVGFKAYAGVLLLGALIVFGLIKRQVNAIVVFILGSLVSGLIFLANFKASSTLLIFSPFWLIHSMIDSPDRIGWARLSLARQAGFEKGNWFKFILVELLSLILFIAGNLGMRILGLLVLIKSNLLKGGNALLLIIILLSFLIPILFIQSGNPWNTIQFSYYGLYLAALFAGYFLSNLKSKVVMVLIPIFLILTPINSITTATYYLGQPHAIVDNKELEALSFLSRQPDGVALTYPYDKKIKQKFDEPRPLFAYDSTAYVSALSNKVVYLEDEGQNQILLTDYKKRLVSLNDFFTNPLFREKFLRENKIRYIYIPKIFNVRLNEDEKYVKKIFENDGVVIYQAET